MIIKGKSRGNGGQLTEYLLHDAGLPSYLLNEERNERVEVLEIDGLATEDLAQALAEMQEIADAGTDGAKGLYHAQISPEVGYELSHGQWLRCAAVLAEELGFTGQPYAIVLHEKKGRAHIHVVWQRTHAASLTLIPDSWNYIAHERAARRLELELGHALVPGKHVAIDGQRRPLHAVFADATRHQAKRRQADPRRRSAEITAAWNTADSARAFVRAIEERGYILARGDRRGLVVVDRHGEVHALTRQIDGVKSKNVKERLAGLTDLPGVTEAKTMAAQRVQAQQNRSTGAKPDPAPETVAERVYPAHWGFDRYEPAAREQKRMQEALRAMKDGPSPHPFAAEAAERLARWEWEQIRQDKLPTQDAVRKLTEQDRQAAQIHDAFNREVGPGLTPEEIQTHAAERNRKRQLEAERAAIAAVRDDGARRIQELGRQHQIRRTAIMEQHGVAERFQEAQKKHLLTQHHEQVEALRARQSAERRRGLSWLIGALTGANARQAERHAEQRNQLALRHAEQQAEAQGKAGEERQQQFQELRALDHAELQERTRLEMELIDQLRGHGWEHDQARGVAEIRQYAETAELAPAYAPAQTQTLHHALSLSM